MKDKVKMGLQNIRLVAIDMDGTLLTSDKSILPETEEAIGIAEKAGIHVVLATGRALAEIEGYSRALGPISYGITESGGLLYDFRNKRVLWRHSFDEPMKKTVVAASLQEEVLLQTMEGGAVIMEDGCLNQLARHQVEHFAELFQESCTMVPDMRSHILEADSMMEKINLYHTDRAARARTRKRLAETGLELADSEYTSLEISPPGVSKGNALTQLCRQIGIAINETAAIGDSDNDLSLLRAAGYAVAMGNANERIKSISRQVTADCDHDGVGLFLRKLAEKNTPTD